MAPHNLLDRRPVPWIRLPLLKHSIADNLFLGTLFHEAVSESCSNKSSRPRRPQLTRRRPAGPLPGVPPRSLAAAILKGLGHTATPSRKWCHCVKGVNTNCGQRQLSSLRVHQQSSNGSFLHGPSLVEDLKRCTESSEPCN